MRVQLLTSLILLYCATAAQAQNKAPTADVNRQMSISYGSPSWNTDSKKIDSAFLVVRDKANGKLVQIQLEETEPDSSEFTGHFSLSLSENEKALPEIYVPPQGQRSEKDYRKLYEAIQKESLTRKPVIWKKNERGQSVLDVYDTREQAQQALKAYQEQAKLAQEMKQKKLIKPIPSESALAAAQQAERKAQLDQLAMDAAKREAERVRLEQIEKQKAAERERQAKAATEAEKAARRARAQKLADEGSAHYAAGEFVSAEEKFKQAVDLDPTNKSYYFKYGVALYRNQKFNESLVILRLAQVDAKTDLERKYYMGLAHYRLGELDPAMKLFEDVARSKDPVMSPSALFYTGMIHFAQEKYEPAKKAFEDVIDTSTDPRLDEQAEEYLDRIANAMVYQKMREQKWNVMGIVGLMYDSNVLLAADNAADQGTSTNIGDFRLLTIAQLDYRPVFNEHHEWQASANAGLTNSNLTNATSKREAVRADPWLYNISAPYSYKGMAFKKGYKLTAKPAVEMLYMDPDQTGTKHFILNSYLLTVDNTFVMSKDWFATYTFEYRLDDSKTADSTGADDADAGKYSLRTIHSVFLDKGKKEAIMGNLGYVLNAAKGANKKYYRIELGATYVRPTSWGASWNLGLNAYKLNFGSADEKRDDLNVTLSTGFTKPIREWVTWGVLGSYTRNNSNLTANQYNKYMILTTATFSTGF